MRGKVAASCYLHKALSYMAALLIPQLQALVTKAPALLI